jgi:hypothetical protein
MTRSSQRPGSSPSEASVAEQLDTLNAKTRAARNPPNALRRTMEARIEAKAKRRRSRETAASSGWKHPG